MKITFPAQLKKHAGGSARTFIAAVLATLIGGAPAFATTFGDVPLQTSVQGVPPNIMMILDDSYSMTYEWMSVNASDYRSKYYAYNTLFYNPKVEYKPWVTADGTREQGGVTVAAAFANDELLSDPKNLASLDGGFYFYASDGSCTDDKCVYRYKVVQSKSGYSLEKFTFNGGTSLGKAVPVGAFGASNNANESQAAQLKNIAIWYSYYRTRMKAAKAAVTSAFSGLGNGYRVGYTTIWDRNTSYIPSTSTLSTFSGANKDDFYSRVRNATAKYRGATPLHAALERVGDYYSGTLNGVPDPFKSIEDGKAVTLSCRQNFAILATDGAWNERTQLLNADYDGTDGVSIANKTKTKTFQYTPSKPYMDNLESALGTQTDTLADVAMKYWKNDLRSDLDNDVPESPADGAFWQHMATFAISIGEKGTLTPGQRVLDQIKAGTTRWPDPWNAAEATRIDDLWHATVNGHGTFSVASDPNALVSSLKEALNSIAERLGSASNVTANSGSIQIGSAVYQASYRSGSWSGELAAYAVTASGVSNGDANGDGKPDALWNASKLVPDFATRAVYTAIEEKGKGNVTKIAGAEFPTSDELDLLQRVAADKTELVSGLDNAKYIKGDQSRERQNGGSLRTRSETVLGDFVNSTPTYNVSGANKSLFIGGNDGMLHGFNAMTGVEQFAYIPFGVDKRKLASLSDPAYTHSWFVDGNSAVTRVDSVDYLTGSLGRGGKGLFGLNVTNPSGFTVDDVVWDLSGDRAPTGMGMVIGQPVSGTLNNGRKVVFVPNGINSSGANTGSAALFVIDPATGANVVAPLIGGAGTDNGLVDIALAVNPDTGYVDYVYGGDLSGNLIRFDVRDANTNRWSASTLFSAGTKRPITGGLVVQKVKNDYWVFFGTGKFLEQDDISSRDTDQAVYGIKDVAASSAVVESQLTKRSIALLGTMGGKAVRSFEASSDLPGNSLGWFVELNNPSGTGERVVSRPLLRGSVLLFSSITPPGDNTCQPGGSGYVNAISAFSGTSTEKPYFDANRDGAINDGDKLVSTSGSAEAIPVGSVDLGIGMPTAPVVFEIPGSSGSGTDSGAGGVSDGGGLVVVGGSLAKTGDLQTPKLTKEDCIANPSLPGCNEILNPPPGTGSGGGSGGRRSWREIIRN